MIASTLIKRLICIYIYKDKGFRLYTHNNNNTIKYYTKSNKQSLKCTSVQQCFKNINRRGINSRLG